MLPACLGFHLSMHWHWWLYGLAWRGLLHELSSMYVGLVLNTGLIHFDCDYVAQNHTLTAVSQVFVLVFNMPL